MLIWPARFGHLLTSLTFSAVSFSPSMTPPWAVHFSNSGFLWSSTISLASETKSSAAPDDGQAPLAAVERLGERRAFGGPLGQAVLDDQQVDVLAPQLLAQA